jgi:hypothetical protein
MRILAIIVLFLNSISGFFGGICFIIYPDGRLLHAPLSLLEHSPFSDFLIPGIILLSANGILSFVILLMTIKKSKNYEKGIIAQGCISMGWITCEYIIVRVYDNLQAIYFLLGLVLFLTGLLLWRKRKITVQR